MLRPYASQTAFGISKAPVEDNVALKRELADVHALAMDAATPGSGVYINEVDPLYKGNWKEAAFGANYDRLLQIKHKYDPDQLLFGHISVGSDDFRFDGSGRLCTVGKGQGKELLSQQKQYSAYDGNEEL